MTTMSPDAENKTMRGLISNCHGKDANLRTFLDALLASEGPKYNHENVPIPGTIPFFETMPLSVTEALLSFAASTPRELCEQADVMMHDADGIYSFEPDDLETLMHTAAAVGRHIDNTTRWLSKKAIWKKLSKKSLSVMSLWKDKGGDIIGEPAVRNLMVDQVPTNLSSLVMVEGLDGNPYLKPRLMVSTGRSDHDGNVEHFLINIAVIVKEAFSERPKGHVVAKQIAAAFVNDLISDCLFPMIVDVLKLAEILDSFGYLKDPEGLFERVKHVRRELTAEGNPNALYEIGGWT